jgi:DUF4097 and DUF4098 domain-containing protein YvlB
MKKIGYLVLPITLLLVSSGCAVHVNAQTDTPNKDIESVLGGISVDKGAHVRDVSSVNGGIDLNSDSTARDVDAVNGGIELGNNVTVKSIETVNGGIDSGSNLKVKQDILTVNGGIDIGKGSQIGGDIRTVNGGITLNQVSVGRNVKTNNGDIKLLSGTIVAGDLIIEKSDGWFSGWFSSDDEPDSEIKIDDTSEVKGTIHLYKKVTLKISEKAKIGSIKKHYRQK